MGQNPAVPTITSVMANPTAVTAGGSASLTGVFTNSTGVIVQGNLTIASCTAVSVSQAQTTTYALTGTNSAGVTPSMTATVAVLTVQYGRTKTFSLGKLSVISFSAQSLS